ncbi:MAG: uroporphyrinogen-III C-methyltransferase [Candidatus Acidiferrales bacterium]
MKSYGKVYLVGAGPGDPGLLTVEALRLLQTAEVIFHDDLVSPEILALIPSETHVESVGKRCGHASILQHQIHSLMINAAKEGWCVVRLKSGDPLIFGRAGEELDALRRAGIEWTIVPGISAAFGAAARAGIPLTDRRLASRIVFLSNHQCAGKSLFNWEGALSEDTTALIYMPGADYQGLAAKLCAQGLKSETPCLVVSHATTPGQKVYPTTLLNLADAPRYAAPVLLIVGAVAAKYAGDASFEVTAEDLIAPPNPAFDFAMEDGQMEAEVAPTETAQSVD